MRAFLKAVTLAGAALAASSCASTPPADTYEILAPSFSAGVPGRSRAQLLIAEPTAIKTLDSEKIAIKPTPTTIEYLAQSQWSDRLPRMVQLRLVQAFQNTGRFAAVGVPGQGLAIDYQLVMEIRKFEVAVAPASGAVIEISAKALNDKTGNVVRSRVFSAAVPITGTGNAAYVAALNQAFDRISREMVTWMLATI
ncbi:ABC-type transport auxiliary lipoprotein family protein [Aurantimonas sp. Leaf443]|uniref:ABC-type transport auxiliary lipoprotein family protein n=1 Tax=Aurantimonas sp. Leaf443 TaxID=1736378 RepID=UPI0006FE891A|nr:ABC-type transport auxiliary lipoprotein family protein [Aurantimonas sp. Leaf443]KQT86227.1 ABC transporter [Aurantimonas sp. Leaf443]